jgi:hypothetical protein
MQFGSGWLFDRFPKNTFGEYPVEAYWQVLVFICFAAVIGLLCTLLMKETFPETSARK